MKIELLWFKDCPNHKPAEVMLNEVLLENSIDVEIERIEVPDLETGNRVKFPGSPTIRINRIDVEPDWEVCDDCTPRCRLHIAENDFSGLPRRDWIENAIKGALAR